MQVPDNPSGPRVWLLLGRKSGDNTQVLALGEALGWPFEEKRLAYRRTELLTNLALGGNLAGIHRRRSSPLAAPWPDLVISAGRRNEPVARWIRGAVNSARKMPVRLVHLGRPWAPLENFDLVVTTPQYALPDRPNVLRNLLPLHRITDAVLAKAAAEWAPRLEHLPRPRVAILVGGHSGVRTFGRAGARRLASQAAALAREEGGSLLVTTSARTPEYAIEAIQSATGIPGYFFRWRPDSPDNPYLGYLALADKLVVTSDSVSMLTEACATRKPVYLFDMEDPGDRVSLREWRAGVWLSRFGEMIAPARMKRDVGVMHRQVIEAGRAAWLGDSFRATAGSGVSSDIDRAVRRVRALFDR